MEVLAEVSTERSRSESSRRISKARPVQEWVSESKAFIVSVDPPLATSSQKLSTPEMTDISFPQFSRLCAEVQRMIWAAVSEPAKTIVINTGRPVRVSVEKVEGATQGGQAQDTAAGRVASVTKRFTRSQAAAREMNNKLVSSKVPIVLRVCAQSRSIGQLKYRPLFTFHRASSNVWVDYDLDTVVFQGYGPLVSFLGTINAVDVYEENVHLRLPDSRTDLEKHIRNLSIAYDILEDGLFNKDALKHVICRFESLQNVILRKVNWVCEHSDELGFWAALENLRPNWVSGSDLNKLQAVLFIKYHSWDTMLIEISS